MPKGQLDARRLQKSGILFAGRQFQDSASIPSLLLKWRRRVRHLHDQQSKVPGRADSVIPAGRRHLYVSSYHLADARQVPDRFLTRMVGVARRPDQPAKESRHRFPKSPSEPPPHLAGFDSIANSINGHQTNLKIQNIEVLEQSIERNQNECPISALWNKGLCQFTRFERRHYASPASISFDFPVSGTFPSMAVCTKPARSLIADVSIARSFV